MNICKYLSKIVLSVFFKATLSLCSWLFYKPKFFSYLKYFPVLVPPHSEPLSLNAATVLAFVLWPRPPLGPKCNCNCSQLFARRSLGSALETSQWHSGPGCLQRLFLLLRLPPPHPGETPLALADFPWFLPSSIFPALTILPIRWKSHS